MRRNEGCTRHTGGTRQVGVRQQVAATWMMAGGRAVCLCSMQLGVAPLVSRTTLHHHTRSTHSTHGGPLTLTHTHRHTHTGRLAHLSTPTTPTGTSSSPLTCLTSSTVGSSYTCTVQWYSRGQYGTVSTADIRRYSGREAAMLPRYKRPWTRTNIHPPLPLLSSLCQATV